VSFKNVNAWRNGTPFIRNISFSSSIRFHEKSQVLFDVWNPNSFRNWWGDIISAEVDGHIMNRFSSKIINACVSSKADVRFIIELEVNIHIRGERNQQITSVSWNVCNVDFLVSLHGASAGFSRVAFARNVNNALHAFAGVITVQTWKRLARR